MVVLAVLLYCLVPSGCPIGHIVYLWTLTVAVSRFFCGAAGQIRTADLILTNCRRAFQPLLFKAFRQFFVQKGRGRSLFIPLFPSMCFPVWVTVWVKQTPLRQRSRGQASPSYFVLPFLSHN